MVNKIVKTMVESPAIVVEKTAELVKKIDRQKPIRVAKKYWGSLGSGLTTGASDDDPSGIATYSQAGAQFGFAHIWLALYSIPFMIVAQEMCARVALVTGRGISGVLKQHYPHWLVYLIVFLVFLANSLNIGADLAGMVTATKLVIPELSYAALAIFFTLISLYWQIKLSYQRYAQFLKYLTLVLLAYVLTAFLVHVDWSTVVIRTLVPHFTFDKNNIFIITAVLGTTISPYLFYWQASQEIEEEKAAGLKTLVQLQGTNPEQIGPMRRDVVTGMIFSNVVMFFIIAVTGVVLFAQHLTINTAADAARALEPLAGHYAQLLFAVGIIGTGFLAIPVLAGSASYAFSEAFSLNQGLDKDLKRAYGFYGVIILAMAIGLIINFLAIDPIKALIFSAVVNGLIAPVLLTLILLVSNNAKIMGQWKNGAWSNGLGWLITLIMAAAGVATIVGLF